MPSRLQDIFDKYPNLRLAVPEDNQAILELIDQIPMEGGDFDIRYKRDPDFFAMLRAQGNTHHVFVMLEEDQRTIGGIGGVSIREGWHEGELTKIGYTSDLRVIPTLWKKTRVQWRRMYAELLKHYRELEEFNGVSFFYSAILGENETAIRALTRQKANLNYRPIFQYHSISILGRKPFVGERYNEYSATTMHKDDGPKLRVFLCEKNREKLLGYHFSDDEAGEEKFRRRRWGNYRWEDFLLIKNSEGDILASCLPWSSSNLRRLYVERAKFGPKCLGRLAGLLGMRAIKVQEELKILYLTHLEFAPEITTGMRGKMVNAFLERLFKSGVTKKFNAIVFQDSEYLSLVDSIKKAGFLTKTVPGYLFQVSHVDNVEETRINEKAFPEVAIEVALI